MFDIIIRHRKYIERKMYYMKYEILREKYPQFIYQDYKIEQDEENIYLKYFFEIVGASKFEPIITIKKKNFCYSDLQSNIAQNIAFNIGMVEAISYYKAACSKFFIVKCAKLTEEQIEFFQKLIYLGLGEFRYINKIQESYQDFVQIISEGEEFKVESLQEESTDVVIPIGGGKDSIVTLELLKTFSQKRYGFRINIEDVSRECAKIAGLEDEEIIEVTRKIDQKLIELNNQGFLNGHTPFSALVAFLTYFVASIFNKKYIALSNEDSANESNVEGENINHQYSKTIEFENDFREYVKKYICVNGPEYFSMLRPISEIQIAQIFSEFEEYHKIFKSCNVGSKSKPWKWCANCPKCLFAYIILSPFLYKEKLVEIFGEDLYEKENLLQTFIGLCGYAENKPFECVGTYKEIRYAISKTIQNVGSKLPFLLEYYKNNFEIIEEDIFDFYNENNNLPEEFEKILKDKLNME